MNFLKNNVQLIGRLGNAPEVKTFDSGKRMATFSLATNDIYHNNKGERIEDTQWHQVVVWGKKVDIVEQYLDKGSEVAVSGKLTYRNYEVEGERRFFTEINLQELLMMSKKAS